MKKILLSVFTVVCFVFSAQAQDEGGLKFGAGINLLDISDGIGLQGKAIYGLNEQFNIGGSFNYWLDDFIDFSIDVNAQYKGLDIAESFKFFPLAGLTFSKFPGANDTDLHIGASFRFVLESGTTVFVEPLLILGTGNGINLAGGILF